MLKLVEGVNGWAIQATSPLRDLAWLDKSRYTRSDITILFEIMDEVWQAGVDHAASLHREDEYEEGYRLGWEDAKSGREPRYAHLEL